MVILAEPLSQDGVPLPLCPAAGSAGCSSTPPAWWEGTPSVAPLLRVYVTNGCWSLSYAFWIDLDDRMFFPSFC